MNCPVRYQRATNNQQDETNAQATAAPPNPKQNGDQSTDKLESSDKNERQSDNATNPESNNKPGPSGVQTNQNDTTPKASQSNPPEQNSNGSNEPGPSNRNVSNQQAVETRQRLIIVQQHNGNDENGNMNRYDIVLFYCSCSSFLKFNVVHFQSFF